MDSIPEKKSNNKNISFKTNFLGFPVWIWISFLFLAFVKLWLVSEQSITAYGDAGHDDRLFINLAQNILSFHWLGEYNQMTLAKGSFYPLWIAFSHFLGIPLLTSQHILYIGACILLILSLKQFLSGRPALSIALYAALLLNPASYADRIADRVIREGIYPTLTLLVIAFSFGLVTRFLSKEKSIFIWSTGLGISLSCFWLTREEGIWIIPLVTAIFLFLLIKIRTEYKKGESALFSNLFKIFLPFIILASSLFLVSFTNYMYYGIFSTVEFKNTDFLRAYASLTRVENANWRQYVPAPAETRMRIYEVSPKFAELKPFLEGDLGKGWAGTSNNWISIDPSEIIGGWFMWALRDAVALAGHYKDGEETMNYYRQMTSEIDAACESGRLECLKNNKSMMPHWRNEYFNQLLPHFITAAKMTVRFTDIIAIPSLSVGKESSLELFQDITNEPIKAVACQPGADPFKQQPAGEKSAGIKSQNYKIKILELIKNFYAVIFLPFLLISTLILLWETVRNKLKILNSILLFFAYLLILTVVFRLLILTLIDVTSFPAISNEYLSPVYPLLIIFIFLPLLSYLEKRK